MFRNLDWCSHVWAFHGLFLEICLLYSQVSSFDFLFLELSQWCSQNELWMVIVLLFVVDMVSDFSLCCLCFWNFLLLLRHEKLQGVNLGILLEIWLPMAGNLEIWLFARVWLLLAANWKFWLSLSEIWIISGELQAVKLTTFLDFNCCWLEILRFEFLLGVWLLLDVNWEISFSFFEFWIPYEVWEIAGCKVGYFFGILTANLEIWLPLLEIWLAVG